MPGAILQPHPGEGCGGDAARVGSAGELQGQHHVLERRQGRNQVKRLEHETDPLRPQTCAAVLIELREIVALQQHAAGAGYIKACQKCE